LTYTLRQWQLWKFLEETLANLSPETLAQQLRLLPGQTHLNFDAQQA
jgi:hypothetical protein